MAACEIRAMQQQSTRDHKCAAAPFARRWCASDETRKLQLSAWLPFVLLCSPCVLADFPPFHRHLGGPVLLQKKRLLPLRCRVALQSSSCAREKIRRSHSSGPIIQEETARQALAIAIAASWLISKRGTSNVSAMPSVEALGSRGGGIACRRHVVLSACLSPKEKIRYQVGCVRLCVSVYAPALCLHGAALHTRCAHIFRDCSDIERFPFSMQEATSHDRQTGWVSEQVDALTRAVHTSLTTRT